MSDRDLQTRLTGALFGHSGSLDSTITRLVREYGEEQSFFSVLFDTLFELKLDSHEASEFYGRIAAHRRNIERSLGRGIDFRVAVLDYLLQIDRRMIDPKIVEYRSFEQKTRLATVDELTGVSNRRHFEDVLERELNRCRRYDLLCSVLFLDIDNFKSVNDTHGHQVGDDVLKAFASLVSTFLRSEDTIGRLGGEEFVVLMPQTPQEGALRLGERLLTATRSTVYRNELSVTFSGGVAEFPEHAVSLRDLLDVADRGLYYAKMTGKARICSPSDDKRGSHRFMAKHPVAYSCAKARRHPGIMRDVSLTGISFETERPPDVGESITLTIENTHGTYTIGSQVVWVQPGDRRYRAGARYTDVHDETVNKILSFASG